MTGDMTLPYAADDVVIMPPGAPQVVGIEAARAWATEFMAAVTVQDLRYTDTKVTVSGNLAVEHYVAAMTMAMSGMDPVSETLKGVHIYRKGADGAIEITDAFSLVDIPADAANEVIDALSRTRIKGQRVKVKRDRSLGQR